MYFPKYIVYRGDLVKEEFVIFPNHITHSDMAFFKLNIQPDLVISAGFIDDCFECFGQSISLNVKSRQEKDTALIKESFNYG